jgi:6-phosphogluconolactonase
MKSPDLVICKDSETLSQLAAERFSALAQAADKTGVFSTAISGGSTPQRMFQILAEKPYRDRLPWQRIHFFWCDERCVPPDHEQSNYASAYALLFSKVDLPAKNIHRIRGEFNPTQAASDYADQLNLFAAKGLRWPRFDLVFLGMGSDGHIASLFPGSISKLEQTSPVLAVTARYEDRPAERVTLTPLVFNTARNIIFLVSGSNKATALRSVLNGPGDPNQWPALRIQPADGTITWLADQEAASLLDHAQ